jgi:hypothetical protein
MEPDPLRLAAQLGTLNAIDRAKQYSKNFGRADPDELLRSQNELWKTTRLNQAVIRDRDKQIGQLHEQLAQRDKLILHQAGYLKSKDLKFWVLRVGLGLLIAAQWSAIAWLAHELLARLH